MPVNEVYKPLTYFGGKSTIIQDLLKILPEHRFYLELFGGSGALLFAKKPCEFEVFNDIDGELINFYNVLKDEEKFKKFYRKVYFTLYSREEFYKARDNIGNGDEVERAYNFFVACRQSFSGNFQSWSYAIKTIRGGLCEQTSKWISLINKLPEFHQRMIRVQIEKLDWYECLKKYAENWDYEDSVVYMDPPYIHETRSAGRYRFEIDTSEHEKLVDWLLSSKCKVKVILSGYEHKIYEPLEKHGWKKIKIRTHCWAVGRTKAIGLLGQGAGQDEKYYRTECVWINFNTFKQKTLFDL